MKKRLQLLLLFMGMVIVCFILIVYKSRQIRFQIDECGEINILVSTDKNVISITPWWNEEEQRFYIFLPSFCKTDNIYIDDMGEHLLFIDDVAYDKGDKFSIVINEEYIFDIKKSKKESNCSSVIFMKSQNIPTLFIDLKSGSLDYLLENKDNRESASISVVTEKGNVEYSGIIDKISGRGNTTWDNYDKKSFAFSLLESKSLIGLETGKDWNLLAVHGEGNRMTTKITMDMVDAVGMDASMNNTWVDVYFNGEYTGNYLLSEAVKIAESRVNIYDLEKENKQNNSILDEYPCFEEDNYKGYDLPNVDTITGGFLIEKDVIEYFENEKTGFKTDLGNCFTIKAPKHASKEQVEYIYDFVNEIEKKIMEGDVTVFNEIDLNSFSKRFLIDEITLNIDADITSVYFYKEKSEDLLYAGPVWDCDSGMGIFNEGWMEGKGVDYAGTITQFFWNEKLEWNEKLLENETYFKLVKDNFIKLLPFMKKIIEEDSYIYEELISPSAKMDIIRWGRRDVNETWIDNYQTYENNVRYMRYFLINRLNYLINEWDIPYEKFTFEGNRNEHTVVYVLDGTVIETKKVKDGEELKEHPYLDEEKYWGWYYDYNNCKTREWLPVLEDCTFYAREK